MKDSQARFVRLPTKRANSVSILREMSSAFTECVSAPLQNNIKRNSLNHTMNISIISNLVACKLMATTKNKRL